MGLFIWLGLLYCGGYYYSITSSGSSLVIPVLFVMIITLLAFDRDNVLQINIRFNKNRLILFIVLCISILLPAFVNGNFGVLEVKYILIMTCSFLIVKRFTFEEFKQRYVQVMFVIALLALLGYVISKTSIITRLPLVTNYNEVEYVNGIFFSAIKFTYSGITNRMQGIFWEPGLFATYISIAILFLDKSMFNNKKRYYVVLFMLIVCLVLSRSGAGIIMLALLAIIKLFENKKGESIIHTIIAFIAYGIIVLLFFLYSTSLNMWVDQYLLSKVNDASNVSNLTRVNSVILDIILFIKNIPFGTGLSMYSYEVSIYKDIYPSSCTSTLTMFLASLGIFGFSQFIFWIRGIIRYPKNKTLIAKVGTIILFLLIA